MGIHYDIDLEKGRVIVVLEGNLTCKKFRPSVKKCGPIRNGEMEVLFTETQNWRRVAIVVGFKGEEFGNKLQNLLKAVEGIRVCRDCTAAEEWVASD